MIKKKNCTNCTRKYYGNDARKYILYTLINSENPKLFKIVYEKRCRTQIERNNTTRLL